MQTSLIITRKHLGPMATFASTLEINGGRSAELQIIRPTRPLQ